MPYCYPTQSHSRLVSFLFFERQFSRANPSLVGERERERERERGRGAEIKMSSVFSIAAAAASQRMIPRTGTWESVCGLNARAVGAAGSVNSYIFQKIRCLGPLFSGLGLIWKHGTARNNNTPIKRTFCFGSDQSIVRIN